MIPGFLRRETAPLFLLILMGAAHSLAGQSPEDRAALEKFRDSLKGGAILGRLARKGMGRSH